MTGIGTDEAGLRAEIEALMAKAEFIFPESEEGGVCAWCDNSSGHHAYSCVRKLVRDLVALLRARSPQIQEPEQ